MEDQNQEAQSALTASQDYLQEHIPASQGGWMNKVSGIPNSLKQYGTTAVTSVKSLSTAQKVAGGGIIAVGAYYLANRNMVNGKIQQAWASRSLTNNNSDATSSQPSVKTKSKKKSKSSPE